MRVAGKCGARVSDIVDGMRWAAGLPVAGVPDNPHPARVVNVSFGGSSPCGAAYQAAIDELRGVGAVVVAAAGNEHAAPMRPANCAGSIGVVGLNRDGFKTHYANFGVALSVSGISTVSGDDRGDVSARWNALADSGILTVANDGRQGPGSATYASHFGTSFAAPIVSGTLALMLGVNPALSHAQLLEGLRLGARPHVTSSQIGLCSDANPGRCLCSTASCGVGILDAGQALLYASAPTAYVAGARALALVDHPDIAALVALGQDRSASNSAGPASGDPSASAGAGAGGAGGSGGVSAWRWLLALLCAAAVLRLRPSGRLNKGCCAQAQRCG